MKIYARAPDEKIWQYHAVNDLSVTIDSGKLVALLGPSGCGKSTILNMLSGILPVTEGKIWFDERDVTALRRKSATWDWCSRITRCIRT